MLIDQAKGYAELGIRNDTPGAFLISRYLNPITNREFNLHHR